MKKRLLSFPHNFVAAACLLVLTGCVPKDNSITIRIGVAVGDASNSWNLRAGTYGGVQSASHRLPYFFGGSANDSLQYVLLGRMAAAECQAVILMPDYELRADTVTKILSEIPIILFERSLDLNYTLLVKGDNTAVGTLAAGFVTDALSGQAPEVLILKAPGFPYNTRIEAFKAAIPGGTFIEREASAATIAAGATAMRNLLNEETPPSFNAIYTADDDLVYGVIQALAANANDIVPFVIAGAGGSQLLLKLIAGIVDEPENEGEIPLTIPEGIAAGTVFYPPVFIQEAVEAAAQLVLNKQEPASREIDGPTPFLVTAENAAQYIDPEALY